MSDPGMPERIVVWPCDHVALVVEPAPVPKYFSCVRCGEKPVPYVRAEVSADMIDRAARALLKEFCSCDCEECMAWSVAEVALRAALGVEEQEANGE